MTLSLLFRSVGHPQALFRMDTYVTKLLQFASNKSAMLDFRYIKMLGFGSIVKRPDSWFCFRNKQVDWQR
jgi:hypothetical protein